MSLTPHNNPRFVNGRTQEKRKLSTRQKGCAVKRSWVLWAQRQAERQDQEAAGMVVYGGSGQVAATTVAAAGTVTSSISDSTTGTVTGLVLKHETAGVVAGNTGLGVGMSFFVEDAGGMEEQEWKKNKAPSAKLRLDLVCNERSEKISRMASCKC